MKNKALTIFLTFTTLMLVGFSLEAGRHKSRSFFSIGFSAPARPQPRYVQPVYVQPVHAQPVQPVYGYPAPAYYPVVYPQPVIYSAPQPSTGFSFSWGNFWR